MTQFTFPNTFNFLLGSKVVIDDGDIAGTITAVSIRKADKNFFISYEVQWFTSGSLQTAWFEEYRLS